MTDIKPHGKIWGIIKFMIGYSFFVLMIFLKVAQTLIWAIQKGGDLHGKKKWKKIRRIGQEW